MLVLEERSDLRSAVSSLFLLPLLSLVMINTSRMEEEGEKIESGREGEEGIRLSLDVSILLLYSFLMCGFADSLIPAVRKLCADESFQILLLMSFTSLLVLIMFVPF